MYTVGEEQKIDTVHRLGVMSERHPSLKRRVADARTKTVADRHTAARGDQLRARDADELRSELKLLAIRHRPLNEQPLQRLVSYRRREPDGFSDALATPGLPADVLHQ